MAAWSRPDLRGVVWAIYAVQIVVLAAWTYPWWAPARRLPRLGTAWLGISYWVIGAAGALVTGLVEQDGHYVVVAGQRLAYLALATVTVLALLKAAEEPASSVTLGLAAAFLVTLGVLFVAGASSVFERVRDVPDHAAASFLEDRFWGGSGIFYHPVSMAGVAVCVGLRLGLDRSLAPWQRTTAVALMPLLIVVTHGRTAAVLALAAAIVALVLRSRDGLMDDLRRWMPSHRTRTVAGMVVVTLAAGATVAYHRSVIDFFTVARYRDSAVAQSLGQAADITSGRRETWRQVMREFRSDGWSEKLLGSSEHSRAVVVRPGDRTDDRVQVLVDNAALGALRRGGVVGALAVLAGLVLLVLRAVRSGVRWFTVAALSSLLTIPSTEWLLGSPLWLLLVGGEAATCRSADRQGQEQPVEAREEGDDPPGQTGDEAHRNPAHRHDGGVVARKL
jgi:hypothetical protein